MLSLRNRELPPVDIRFQKFLTLNKQTGTPREPIFFQPTEVLALALFTTAFGSSSIHLIFRETSEQLQKRYLFDLRCHFPRRGRALLEHFA